MPTRGDYQGTTDNDRVTTRGAVLLVVHPWWAPVSAPATASSGSSGTTKADSGVPGSMRAFGITKAATAVSAGPVLLASPALDNPLARTTCATLAAGVGGGGGGVSHGTSRQSMDVGCAWLVSASRMHV